MIYLTNVIGNLAAFLINLQGVQMDNSASKQEVSNEVVQVNIQKNILNSTTDKYVIFDVQFTNWEENHLHWVSPSNMVVYNDGSWFIFASHIANMKRQNGPFDVGWEYTWYISVQYLNAQNSILHSKDYVLRTLNYKGEVDNVTASGVDARLPEVLSQIDSANFGRIIG